MTFDPLSRRMFLRGAAGSALAIPLLSSLLPKSASAQGTATKRFISIITGYDMGHHAAWLPAMNSPITNLAQPLRTFAPGNGHHAIKWQPLRDFAPTASSVLSTVAGSAFSPYLESMTVMRSLNHMTRYGHGAAPVLGGIIGERTLHPDRGNLSTIETADVVLNKNRAFNPAGLPLIFAGTGGYGPDAYSYTAVAGGATGTASIGDDLTALYNRLFTNGTFPQTGSVTVRHPRYDILTRVQEDYTRVRNSRHISAADRVTLDNALDQFRDTQLSLTRVSSSQCSYSSLPRSGQVLAAASNPAVGAALANLVVASMLCDSARVFTLGVPSLGGTVDGQDDGHESVSHVPFSTFSGKPSWQISAERKNAIVRNFVAPLVQRLSAAIDPANGQSYLYNSLVYFTAESGIAHGFGSHPVMLFGNAGGAVRPGNYIDYADRAQGAFSGGDGFVDTPGAATFSNNWHGVSYNRLMVTILQAMGLQPADYENDALNAQLVGRTGFGPRNSNLGPIGGFGYACCNDIANADTNNWGFDAYIRPGLEGADLRQYRHPLPMPL